ncbi:MAG: lysophospholipid acyltransferase family protein [Candidatus Aureabacteria bacterium]|nr:lysophospholipid acyltransferase family protein [Candidatus Auribacterota bacterium]
MARGALKLQQILKPVIRVLFRILSRIRVVGLENLPSRPPYIVFSNHISWFDPFLVGSWVPAPVYFMTMEGLLKFPPLGLLLRCVGAFPVSRGSLDRSAIENSTNILESGGVVFIFPEGGIGRLRKGEKLRPGISLIAQRTNVPLVPVDISGCRGLYHPLKLLTRRVSIEIRIGVPFPITSVSDLAGKKMRQMVMDRITREMYSLARE